MYHPFLACLLGMTTLLVSAEPVIRFTPPADSGVVDVRTFGAVGDGRTDDTAALREAIHATYERVQNRRYAAPPMIWLPAGTYLVSGPIESRTKDHKGWSAGWRSSLLLMGEGRDLTVIKLADKAPEYQDRTAPRWVIGTGSESDGNKNTSGGGNRAFRHAIMHLTVDVGKGNPGAIGIDFIANNRGTIQDVTIRAPADSGRFGLGMERPWPGPALIKNVTIEGFDVGVQMAQHYEYSMTFDGLTLSGQRELGMRLRHNAAFISRLTSRNKVTAIRQDNGDKGCNGLLTLHAARLEAPPGTNAPALALDGTALLRDVETKGYAVAIDDLSAANRDVAGGRQPVRISHWMTGTTIGPATGEPHPLHLPVEDTPLYFPDAKATWVNGAGDLQAAIDSGAAVVYLPNGSHTVSQTVIIRNTLRKLIGFQSALGLADNATDTVVLRFEGNAKATTVIEHLWFSDQVEHAGAGTLAIRHCDLHGNKKRGTVGYVGSGSGRSFLEDIMGHLIVTKGHSLWGRQVNSEFSKEPLLRNHGGRMWILGYKTEGQVTALEAIGGETEIFGALLYPLQKFSANIPAIRNDGGRVSMTWANSGTKYGLQVTKRTTVDGPWRDDRTPIRRCIGLYSTEGAPAR